MRLDGAGVVEWFAHRRLTTQRCFTNSMAAVGLVDMFGSVGVSGLDALNLVNVMIMWLIANELGYSLAKFVRNNCFKKIHQHSLALKGNSQNQSKSTLLDRLVDMSETKFVRSA